MACASTTPADADALVEAPVPNTSTFEPLLATISLWPLELEEIGFQQGITFLKCSWYNECMAAANMYSNLLITPVQFPVLWFQWDL